MSRNGWLRRSIRRVRRRGGRRARRWRWSRRRSTSTATDAATPLGVHRHALLERVEDLHDAILQSASALFGTAPAYIRYQYIYTMKTDLQVEMEADILDTATGNKDTLPKPVDGRHVCARQWENPDMAVMTRAIELIDNKSRLVRVEGTNGGHSSHFEGSERRADRGQRQISRGQARSRCRKLQPSKRLIYHKKHTWSVFMIMFYLDELWARSREDVWPGA
jgi:hypothetical protein